MNEGNWKYGYCECGAMLIPVWYTEYEYNKYGYETGRRRTACSHLTCAYCLKNYIVDDTFDEPWYQF